MIGPSIRANWRYRATVPFAREVPADQCEEIADALARLPVKHTGPGGRSTQYCSPDTVDISADAATVEFTLNQSHDYSPAAVLGATQRRVTEWHRTHAPLSVAQPTRAGGEGTLDLVTASPLSVDDSPDPAATDGEYYLLAYPDKPLSSAFVEAVAHRTGDDVQAGDGWLAVIGGPNPHGLERDDGGDTLREVLAQLPTSRVPEADLDVREFWTERELGTVLADDAAAILCERARQQSTHAPADETDNAAANEGSANS